MIENYLKNVRKQLKYYKGLGERTFDQLTQDDLLHQFSAESNSIAIIVNHLWGNMLSRWTDFLTSDGEKEWRNRDLEFENVIQSKAALIAKWEEAWECVFNNLDQINEENFHTVIYIRKQEHTIVEAINRQLMHYSYHIGQIVFLGKMIKGSQWKSLSIPKGDSQLFNEKKMAKGIHGGHFTDDIK